MTELEAKEWLRQQLSPIVTLSAAEHPTGDDQRRAEEAFDRIAAKLTRTRQ